MVPHAPLTDFIFTIQAGEAYQIPNKMEIVRFK